MTELQPMTDAHPMWERLQRQITRLGVTIEQATAEALMSWTCSQEACEARLPRHWTIDDIDEARQLMRQSRGRPGFSQCAGGDITLDHDHPFYGHIAVTGELVNALMNEP